MEHKTIKDCEKFLEEGNSLGWKYYEFGNAIEKIINNKGERWFHTKNLMKNHWFITISTIFTILSFIKTGHWLWGIFF